MDDALLWLRTRASRRRSASGGSLRDAVSDHVSRAIHSSQAALVNHSATLLTPRRRGRLGIALLVITGLALTTVVVLQLSGPSKPVDEPINADLLSSLAANRDARRAGLSAPQPMRSTPRTTQPTGRSDQRR